MNLVIDALIAIVKLTDRGLSAAENVLRFRPSPLGPSDGEAPPAGVDSAVAASAHDSGGHPGEPTSELLTEAAAEIQNLGQMAYSTRQPWIEGFAAELRDRAAQFRAVND